MLTPGFASQSVFFPIRWPILALGLLLVAAACADGSETPPSGGSSPVTGNLFPNPGLEEGRDPWFSLKPPDFLLTDDLAQSGSHSAHLPLQADQSEVDAKIIYLVQEVSPKELPEVISGYYRVESWNRGTAKQYLQFVVIVRGADNLPGGYSNHQIRYLLAGIDRAPFAISNAFFQFLNTAEPALGEWVPFKVNVADDFSRLWGAVPKDFEKIRVLFEVRWDDKSDGDGTAEADVYYDDLYVGGATPDGGGGE